MSNDTTNILNSINDAIVAYNRLPIAEREIDDLKAEVALYREELDAKIAHIAMLEATIRDQNAELAEKAVKLMDTAREAESILDTNLSLAAELASTTNKLSEATTALDNARLLNEDLTKRNAELAATIVNREALITKVKSMFIETAPEVALVSTFPVVEHGAANDVDASSVKPVEHKPVYTTQTAIDNWYDCIGF